MIIVVDGANSIQYRKEIRQMFELRKRVFKDQLGWDVPVVNGQESDEYDKLGAVYIMSLDEETQCVRGSLRIMPTTGPHLMRDVFNAWFENPIVFESANIWEVTRFCIDPEWQMRQHSIRGVNFVTAELLAALCKVSHSMGLTQLTGICHGGMINVLRRARWAPEIIDRSDYPSTGRVFLGLWDVSKEILDRLDATAGRYESMSGTLLDPETTMAA